MQQTTQPFEDYDGHWVHPRLAVGAWPRVADVPEIVGAGIKGILHLASVCAKQGVAYVHELPESLAWRQLGFWDGWRPDLQHVQETLSPVYAKLIVEQSAEMVRDHSPVLFHCMGGKSRSGNAAAIIYAALEDIEPHEAIERMRRERAVLGHFAYKSFWRHCEVGALVTTVGNLS